MKKTLVALAALATVGAAFAQSSVTLYGKIDWEVVSKSTRAVGTGITTNPGIQVNSAGLSGSRWGMRGSEDLGGGMSAIFDLQGGFNVDTGQTAQCGGANVVSVNACVPTVTTTTSTVGGVTTSVSTVTPGTGGAPRIFGRQAFAGLKGGFGQLTVGRQYAPYDNVFGRLDAQGYTSNSAMGAVLNSGGHADAGGPGRVDNHITYFTPAMGGFNAQLSFAPGENRTPTTRASRYAGLGLGYANGPINVDFAYENMRAAGTGGTTDAWIIGGSYDLGFVKPFLAYERAENAANTQDRGWALGALMAAGPATLQVGYARETSDPTVGPTSTVKGLGGQLVYPLSKRTNVYVEALATRTSVQGIAVNGRARQLGVGMRHDF